MKTICAFTLFLFFVATSFAQEVQLAGIDYTYYPKADSKEGNDKIDYQEMSAFIQYPILLNNKKDILVNKLSYGLVAPTLHSPLDGKMNKISENYHSIGYGLSWIHIFNSKWLLLASANVSIDSDLHEKLSGDDFVVGTFGLVRYTIDKNLKIGLGVTYSTTLGEPLWLPVGEAEYTDDKMSVALVFPVKASVMMKANNKKLRYGVSGNIGGNNFNLGNFTSAEGLEVDKVRYSRINVGPLVEYDIADGFTLSSSVGVTTNRILKFEVADDRLAVYNTKAGPFFAIGMSYSLSK